MSDAETAVAGRFSGKNVWRDGVCEVGDGATVALKKQQMSYDKEEKNRSFSASRRRTKDKYGVQMKLQYGAAMPQPSMSRV